jgi:hypothetical protein
VLLDIDDVRELEMVLNYDSLATIWLVFWYVVHFF